MGACGESSLLAVATIRPATWDDLDAVYALLDARSRAAFGVSDVQLAHVRAEWELPSFEVGRDNWVAADNGAAGGYASLESRRDCVPAARDDAVGDGLLARVEERAREKNFDWIAVTAVPEDEPLSALVRRNDFELDREILRMWKTLDGELRAPV